MASLAKLLPKPRHSAASESDSDSAEPVTATNIVSSDDAKIISCTTASVTPIQKVIPRTLDETTGRVRYEVLAQVGHGPERRVQARHADTVAQGTSIIQPRPSPEEVAAETAKVQRALEDILQAKIRATQPKSITGRGDVVKEKNATSIVTFAAAGQGVCSSKSQPTIQRIVKMVEAPRDPLEPPKFRHKRIPRPPGSPPAPVLHSPPRKATAKEQRAWKIPPCVSNWKNPKGYTIPLDKRLAADGRGLVEAGINDNFARVAESLYLAERHAREEVSKRAAIERKLAEQEKAVREEALRDLARQAREEKALLTQAIRREEGRRSRSDDLHVGPTSLREREEIRRERAQQIERDLRVARLGASQRSRHQDRQRQDRDISERIALGMTVGDGASGQRTDIYDQRLFDRTSGVGPGWGDEEEYNLYEGPLFRGSRTDAHVIYKPRDDSKGSQETAGGGGPVEFERATDPFGLDQFLQEARKAKEK